MSRTVFCNWQVEDNEIEKADLLSLSDLDDVDILFFDPLSFALDHSLRTNRNDLWPAEYIEYEEKPFLKFIGEIKEAVVKIKTFLERGGIWVIRSNFPNSHLKIRKQSKSGSTSYTDSVTSVFYWMEEFFGRHSFQYGVEHSLQFKKYGHHLYKTFREIPVDSREIITFADSEHNQVLAVSRKYPHPIVICRRFFEEHGGDIYIIPRFLVEHEYELLIDAFSKISHDKKFGATLPDWFDSYDQKLDLANPYTRQIEQLEAETRRIEGFRQMAQENRERVQEYLGILYETGDALKELVTRALSLFGFKIPDLPSPIAHVRFDFYLIDEELGRMTGRILADENGPIPLDEYMHFSEQYRSLKQDHPPTALLISNAPIKRPPSRRGHGFAKDVISENWTRNYCLISTFKMFELVCLLLEKYNSPLFEGIRQKIREDLLNCQGVFEPDTRKYLAAATLPDPENKKRDDEEDHPAEVDLSEKDA